MAASVLRPLVVQLCHKVQLRPQLYMCLPAAQNVWRQHKAGWAMTSASRLQEEVTNTVETKPDIEQAKSGINLFQELCSIGSVAGVLENISQQDLSGNEASVAVSALRHIHRNNPANTDFHVDLRFRSLSTSIAKRVKNLSNESLTSTLTNIFYMDSKNDELILALEGECRRRLRLLPVRSLSMIVCSDQLLSAKVETKALVYEAARVLELRWRELENPQIVRRLLPCASRVSEPLLEKIEDKTLEMLDQFSFEEMAGLTRALASTKTRSLPLLRGISYQLQEQRAQWETAAIIDIMSSMNTLGFHNPALFKEFASHIQQNIDNYSLHVLCDIAKTYAVLRFKSPELMDTLHRIVAGSMDKLKTLDLKKLLFAYCQLGYTPPSADAFYEDIGRTIAGDVEWSLRDLVDLVHSLAVLQKAPEHLLEKVLQPSDAHQEQNDSLPTTQMLKLLQIESYASLELPSYQGPHLPSQRKSFPPQYKVFTTTLHRSVIKVLRASLGDDFTITESVPTDMGYVIDANISSRIEENSQKMAVVTFGPPCYVYSSRQLIGRQEMMLRHLKLAGYQVLEISYHDWYPLKTPQQQINYLKEKLAHILT